MPRHPRLDPESPLGEPLNTRLAPADADLVADLANRQGLSRPALPRAAVLDYLERADGPPPDDG